MPLDVLGCTRATLAGAASGRGRKASGIRNPRRAGARSLQLLIFNEEFLVSAIHQIALITSLPFVHTARRSYRLNGAVRRSDGLGGAVRCAPSPEVRRTLPFRGRRSRNKVSVGEPAEGSLPNAFLSIAPRALPAPAALQLRRARLLWRLRASGAAEKSGLRAGAALLSHPPTNNQPTTHEHRSRRKEERRGSERLCKETQDNSQQRISWFPQR